MTSSRSRIGTTWPCSSPARATSDTRELRSMPIYVYECQACRQRFERRQSFRDDPIKVCPQCGGATRRVLQAPPIIFKGSGWYATDSRPPETASTGSSSGSAGSGSDAGSNPAEKKPSPAEKKPSPAEKKPSPTEKKD